MGRQRRFLHVAQRPDGLDLGAALAARGAVLGRGPGGARRRTTPGSSWRRPRASCCWPSRPTGSSSSRPAPRPTTANGASASTAATRRSWSRSWRIALPTALDRGHRRAAELAERDALFPDVLPALAAALGGSRSLVARLTHGADPVRVRTPSPPTRRQLRPRLRPARGRRLSPAARRARRPRVPARRPPPERPAARMARGSTSRPTSTASGGSRPTAGSSSSSPASTSPCSPRCPARDRVEQIRWMHEAVRRRFGVDARGLWLTERVWEPELAADLADAGVRYALVDDRHFLVDRLRRRAAPRAVLDRERRQARRPVSDRRAAALPDPVPPAGGDRGLPARAARRRPPAGRAGGRRREVRRLARHQGVGVRAGLARPLHRDDRRAGGERRGRC